MNQAAGASAVEAARWAPVEIDLLGPGDWQVLRSACLAALLDSPEAFVATVAAEARRTSAEWIASLESSTWAVARDVEGIVGIACLVAAVADARKEHFIESVWVTPEHRRQGLVRKMLRRLETEARAQGAEYLQLWVLETNDAAYDAYLKLDFDPVPDKMQDSSKRRGDGTFVQERLMVKPLF
jgi:ribosomal protein S18 acetylase RimI-like enzyme